mmetsp:Transcript_61330/g.146055  ORF Transcript_61330/g.146055 Transcript_61330/m.146055 type:complete len:632 (+) Transcript_61330:92-1987(+)
MVRGRPTVQLNNLQAVSDIDREISGARRLPGGNIRLKSTAEEAGELHRCVVQACVALGRSDQVDHVLAYLNREWLASVEKLANLTDSGWSQLQLPLGLKEELKHNLRVAPIRTGGLALQAPAWQSGGSSSSAQPPPWAGQEWPPRPPAGPPVVLEGWPSEALGPGRIVGGEALDWKQPAGADKEAEQVINRLRAFVRRKGGAVLKSIAAKFRQVDVDTSGGISKTEFREGLVRVMGDFPVTEDETEMLWRHLDANGSGSIDFEEFLLLLNGGLNAKRREAVRLCFRYLDRTGNGVLDINDLKMRYDPSPLSQASPHLLSGPRPSDAELRRFLENFRKVVGGVHSGMITASEFEKYYERVSASIDSDEYFEAMLQRSWELPEGYARAGPFTEYRASSRKQDYRGSTGAAIMQRIRAALVQNPVSTEPLVTIYNMARTSMPYMPVEMFARYVAQLCPELMERELGLLAVLFAEEEGVDVPLFIRTLYGSPRYEARASALAAMFVELTGANRGEVLNLRSLQNLPRFMEPFRGQSSISIAEFLDFHLTIGAGIADDKECERLLRQAWSLQQQGPRAALVTAAAAAAAPSASGVGAARAAAAAPRAPPSVPGLASSSRLENYPGYYKGKSFLQLG